MAAWRGFLVLLAACLALAVLHPEARDFSGLREQLAARLDPSRWPLLDDWLGMIVEVGALEEEVRLIHVNDFINSRITFEDDVSVWGQSDYWATPLQTLSMRRGDCEDFAIIKYVSLRLAGVPGDKLRLVYAKARLDGLAKEPVWVAHMVLAYYPAPNAEPLILDNLDTAIQPASQRPDLQPVFSFSSDGIFAGVSGQGAAKAAVGIDRLSRWEDAWRRILADAYE
ncbi:MAG: transglutaminase-like cysteine peptidase [Candidatus Accumulibacter sp.]|jgi:predicted transglutaminase-like cysteine proteinase|nr:transglutaminase-like cysteine peptidase [Accumulibacter sp.]